MIFVLKRARQITVDESGEGMRHALKSDGAHELMLADRRSSRRKFCDNPFPLTSLNAFQSGGIKGFDTTNTPWISRIAIDLHSGLNKQRYSFRCSG